jgi:sialidase-1
MVKDPAWNLLFEGPGRGIQTRDGTLVFPAQFKAADKIAHSCLIFSGDRGKTWQITPAAIPGNAPTSEAQVAELADGALLLSMRNETNAGVRAWARWEWSGTRAKGRWSAPYDTVTDPTCMASLIGVGDRLLLFANPNHRRARVALTVRASTDGGRTWSEGRLLDPRPCAYSCLSPLGDGTIGIVYETGDRSAYETLTFARFPLDWVRGR